MGVGVVIGSSDERDISVEGGGIHSSAGQALKRERDRNAGCAPASFEVADLTPALEPNGGPERFQRQAQFLAKRGDVHAPVFAYHEQRRKADVRNAPADMRREFSHNANMAKKATGPTDYEALRQSSGWYAAAWRDFRGITQQELADEVGSSRGQISDLETGAKTRFNRDWVERFGRALNVTGGRLIDVNPFTLSERLERIAALAHTLDDDGQDAVLDTAERWSKRTGTVG